MKLKYKIMLALIVVAMGLCFMTLQSYALWIARYESGENIAEVGCFSVNFLENQGPISLNNTYPISDTRALNAGVYYSFSVSNTCTTDSKYAVTINPLKSNTLAKDKIKYAIYKSTETKPTSGINLGTVTDVNTDLSSFSNASAIDESLIVATGYLKGATTSGGNDGESVTYILYLWMDENDTLADKNKTFEASVYVSNVASTKHLPLVETVLGFAQGADPTSTVEIDKGTDSSGCTNTLAYDDYGNLRYVGANPCNYVTFNGESAGWRIIGVFDNQIKLIRSESIGKYSWDSSRNTINTGYGINQWGESTYEDDTVYTGADLMNLLNPGFENHQDEIFSYVSGTGYVSEGNILINNSLYWNRGAGNCFTEGRNSYSACDFSSTGLTDDAKSMLSLHQWHVGTPNDVYSSGNYRAYNYYGYEMGDGTGKIHCVGGSACNDKVNRTTTWQGYVGLLSLSDFGYAVGGEARTNCLATTDLNNYNKNDCNTNDWLVYSADQRAITPQAQSYGYNLVYTVSAEGYLDSSMASSGVDVRPSLFLKSETLYARGNGSASNPYVLTLE